MMTDTERAAKCLLSLQQALYHATAALIEMARRKAEEAGHGA